MDNDKSYVAATDAESALRLQRDNYVKVLEAITDGIYIVNRDCDIEYVNPVIEREFGKVSIPKGLFSPKLRDSFYSRLSQTYTEFGNAHPMPHLSNGRIEVGWAVHLR